LLTAIQNEAVRNLKIIFFISKTMQHFETHWKSSDGIDIFAQGWEPDSHSPKAVVCLVHGVGEHTSRYAHVGDALAKKGFALFGSDMRGHGLSGGKRGHIPSEEAILLDIDMLFENARSRYPGIPIILYGHSLGGIRVLHYSLKRKPDVKGVIATSSGLRTALENQPAKILFAKIFGSLFPGFQLHSGLDVNAISHDPEVIKAYKTDPLVHDYISLGFGNIMLAAAKWSLQHAAEFSLPLLLLHGTSDALAFPSGSKDFAEPLKGKCTLVLFDGAYHELHNEPEKEQVFKTMIDWINERLGVK
jgi:acylglycerol lipase